MAGGRKPYYLPASRLAEMGECEQRIVLARRLGKRTTAKQREAQDRGTRAHEAFHSQVTRHHNERVPTSSTDKRCFIASAVFGSEDIRTDRLRRFRDHVLSRHAVGRWFTRTYYRWSPRVAAKLDHSPRLRAAVAKGLEWLMGWLPEDGT